MIIKDVMTLMQSWAPLNYAEDFDNVGLLVGDPDRELKGILVTLDTLEATVDEAIEKNCNLIISFHPIIFKGLKSLTGKTYVERTVIRAIQNDIAIYAVHTALDNHFQGVNAMICNKLGLINRKVLIPQQHTIKKLQTYVPDDHAESLRTALFEAGAGNIGNYDHCSFNLQGTGTFRGGEGSDPVVGKKGELHFEKETQLNITYPKHAEGRILKALKETHPYEEVAYEIYGLDNSNQHIGLGMTGDLPEAMNESSFLKDITQQMNTPGLRHSALRSKPVKKVAVLGGSGAFAIEQAIAAGADVFVTADLKYHDFYRAEGKIVLADIGHYESEQFTKELIVKYLTKKITNFAVVLSTCNTNPVKYLY
ncbi:Nif3-like dinuclear metal center hexameric protein [Robertkochia aurantiaca]|uniref:Nif3-like dinuclear metal center hexameric protein n=1 Tax=Robertkochia aurantiaca TaxID=2873700 RepID=UPI001CCC700B|nr:Nif3-like dinuclear metal center hexameric protein [Robertkochia sp. 3YJGBD-33]